MTVAMKMPLPPSARARTVTAVLGPTNTGKTHLAIERMLGHGGGLIGLPLRLLAREVYGRLVERAGVDAVALVTGEERIEPAKPRYFVCTVEAMPETTDLSFVAIDEVQLAGDLARGRVFTDRILSLRGRDETLLLGAPTARPLLEKLVPGINVVVRPRMSVLTYAGQKKITRLPTRSAVVAFSADEVYAIAELIRRQRGGAAVVLGSLSPRTRNAQVELFQNGDVDFLVATDAIGMGLNLDVEHVAFAANRKFDGYQHRLLSPAELGQIAGRAGRHTRDGTFGVTGRADPFDDELVQALETHHFAPLRMFQWRNSVLDFSSLTALRASLDETPREEGLTRAPPGDDVVSLDFALRDPEIRALARDRSSVALLWDVCQVPDYRKIAPANHADLILALYGFLARRGTVDDDWFGRQVAFADRVDGDIDTLANRIAHIRTWTYVANRGDWLSDPNHWRGVTRDVEDRLSDALHERLTQRFVDRRTSVLMRRLRENAMLDAEITPTGDVTVEGQHVGHLQGFRFVPAAGGDGVDGKALRAAAAKALAGEIDARAERLSPAQDGDFVLAADGAIRWLGDVVAKLVPGDEALKPGFVLLADEHLTGPARDQVHARVATWLSTHIGTLLKPLFDLTAATELGGLARGIAFRIAEGLGVVERPAISDEIKSLDQPGRGALRQLGVRFGAYHLFVPALLKPAPSRLLAVLWALKHADLGVPGLLDVPQLSASGRTSITVDPTVPPDLYRVCGFKVCGVRAVRIDILERLADIIRPILAWRPGPDAGPAPEGAHPQGGFMATVRMTSLVGCSGEDFASILKGLGYRMDRRPAPQAPAPVDAAAVTPETEAPAAVEPIEAAAGEDITAAEAEAELVAGTVGEDTAPEAVDETSPAEAFVAEASAAEPFVVEDAAETPAADAADDAEARQAAVIAALGEAADAEAAIEAEVETHAETEALQTGPMAEPLQPAEAEALGEPASAEPVAAEDAEPALVEVWRPAGRGERHGNQQRRNGGRPGQRDNRDRGRGGNRGERGGSSAPAAGEAVAAEATRQDAPSRDGARDSQSRGGRGGQNRDGQGREGGRNRFEDRGNRGGDAGKGRRDDNRGERGGERQADKRDDRRDDRQRRDNNRPQGDRGERRQQTIDPNSPFAALAALKADLERRGR